MVRGLECGMTQCQCDTTRRPDEPIYSFDIRIIYIVDAWKCLLRGAGSASSSRLSLQETIGVAAIEIEELTSP